MIRSTIAGNRSGIDSFGDFVASGGGMYFKTAPRFLSTIKNSTFAGNSTGPADDDADGGGLYTDLGGLRVTGSTFSHNRAGDAGGAIEVHDSEPLRLTDTTISGNRARGNGGGIDFLSGEVSLNAVTVVRNVGNSDGTPAGRGGGILYRDGLRIENSLGRAEPDRRPGRRVDSQRLRRGGGPRLPGPQPLLEPVALRARRPGRLRAQEPQARQARAKRRPDEDGRAQEGQPGDRRGKALDRPRQGPARAQARPPARRRRVRALARRLSKRRDRSPRTGPVPHSLGVVAHVFPAGSRRNGHSPQPWCGELRNAPGAWGYAACRWRPRTSREAISSDHSASVSW